MINSFDYYKEVGIKYFISKCYFRIGYNKNDVEYHKTLYLMNEGECKFVTDPLFYIKSWYVYYNKEAIKRYGNHPLTW